MYAGNYRCSLTSALGASLQRLYLGGESPQNPNPGQYHARKDRPSVSVRKRDNPSIVPTFSPSHYSSGSSESTLAPPLVLAQPFLNNHNIAPKPPSLSSDRDPSLVTTHAAHLHEFPDKSAAEFSTQWTLRVSKLPDEHRVETQIKFELELENTTRRQHEERGLIPHSEVGYSAPTAPVDGSNQEPVRKFIRVPRTPGVKASKYDTSRDVGPEFIMDLTADVFSATNDQIHISCCQPCQKRERKKYIKEGRGARLTNPAQTTSPSIEQTKSHVSPVDFAGHELVPIMMNCIADEVEAGGPVEPWFEHLLDQNVSELKQDARKLEQKVTLALRIVCYCRHHRAKNGFKIRFTLKDHRGQILGSAVSNPIMIIDNHKNLQRRARREQSRMERSASDMSGIQKRKRLRKDGLSVVQSKTTPLQARPIPHTSGTDIMVPFLGINMQD